DGFSRRSGIHAVFSVPEDLGRLSSELELTLFRIVQEALSNVHRHSQSPTASIVLSRDGKNLRLEIADEGIGINHGQDAAGVGLAGMRERVKLLRGDLEIKTGPAGTTIRTVLPVMEVKQTTSGTAV
ncbi:MAG: sensor histidine kinase, partial [Candidatus Angelobacter sp.]